MPDFPIVDTHVHLYDPDHLRYSWMAGNRTLEGRHALVEFDALRGGVEVEGIVFMEAGADPGQHLDEAAWVASIAAGDARLSRMVASVPLENGAAARADLVTLQAYPQFCGVRRLIQDEPDLEFCLQPGFVEGVRLLAQFDLGFDLCIRHSQLANATLLVRRCPDVRFVLDHIGKPGIRAGLTEPWRQQIRELAALPNSWCKLSGVITEADHANWTRAQIRPYVEHVIACFGLERIMFGSDWPVSEQTHRYADWVGILDEITQGCSAAESAKLFRDNAKAFYRPRS